jgi:sialate O-acetylesterase
MKRIFTLSVLSLAAMFMANAKVELPPIFADHMVLQQQTDAALWGKAEPGKKVTITTTWSKAKVTVTAGEDGKWFARVATPVAGGPYEITFNDGDKLTLKNVLIGEVWICSGQSNMEMQMKGFSGQPVKGAADLIMTAKPSTPIRSCNLKRVKALDPQDTCEATWYEHNPEGVFEASATAYFFARKLYEVLQIPVGIINVSWGGTPIEAWMNPELLKKEFSGELKLGHLDSKVWPEKNPKNAPGVLYNGMLHTVVPYTAKGFIWYQGCNNRKKFEQYKRLQPAFVQMLRDEWGNQDMGFYFTQIAPYKYEDPNLPHSGYMMWAQAQTLAMIPHSGMATTHDAGEFACIHPADKKTVGDRLAYLALSKDYGYDTFEVDPPIYKSFEVKDGEALVTFEVGKKGLCPISTELDGFELAGEDKVFYPAKARVDKNRNILRVRCPEVPNPVAVRYGMKNWSVATVYNCFGIPVSPFRTDNWE